MQRTRIIKINSKFKVLTEHSGFLSLILLFIIFFSLGCVFIFKNNYVLEFIKNEVIYFLSTRKGGKFTAIFLNSILFIIPCTLTSFVCGTSIVGCVLSPLFLIYKSFVLGAYAGYLYATYQLEGIVFNALVFIPSALVSVFALILSIRESVSFSVILADMCIKGQKNINMITNFKYYCYKHLIILGLLLLSVLLDIGCSALFIKFFNF